MRTTEAHRGLISPKCFFLLIIVLSLLVVPVYAEIITPIIPDGSVGVYNRSYSFNPTAAQPFTIWVLAIEAGIFLILLSFMSGLFSEGEEGLVSILAWIPISYALYTSFAVDMLTGFGVSSQFHDPTYEYVLMESHTVYHFDVVAVVLFILLAFAIGNTYRIWVSQKKLRELTKTEVKEV